MEYNGRYPDFSNPFINILPMFNPVDTPETIKIEQIEKKKDGLEKQENIIPLSNPNQSFVVDSNPDKEEIKNEILDNFNVNNKNLINDDSKGSKPDDIVKNNDLLNIKSANKKVMFNNPNPVYKEDISKQYENISHKSSQSSLNSSSANVIKLMEDPRNSIECIYYTMSGTCKKGVECPYKHDDRDSNNNSEIGFDYRSRGPDVDTEVGSHNISMDNTLNDGEESGEYSSPEKKIILRSKIEKVNKFNRKINDKPCRFFLSNSCHRGKDCPYSHDKSSIPCVFYHLQKRCFNKKCEFSHKKLTEKSRKFLIENEKRYQVNKKLKGRLESNDLKNGNNNDDEFKKKKPKNVDKLIRKLDLISSDKNI